MTIFNQANQPQTANQPATQAPNQTTANQPNLFAQQGKPTEQAKGNNLFGGNPTANTTTNPPANTPSTTGGVFGGGGTGGMFNTNNTPATNMPTTTPTTPNFPAQTTNPPTETTPATTGNNPLNPNKPPINMTTSTTQPVNLFNNAGTQPNQPAQTTNTTTPAQSKFWLIFRSNNNYWRNLCQSDSKRNSTFNNRTTATTIQSTSCIQPDSRTTEACCLKYQLINV